MVFVCISVLKYSENSVIEYFIQDRQSEKLTITQQGVIQFDNLEDNSMNFQLTPYSRVSFLGCWLIISSPGSSKKVKTKFIFKDSLSSADYSRLSRVITALKLLP